MSKTGNNPSVQEVLLLTLKNSGIGEEIRLQLPYSFNWMFVSVHHIISNHRGDVQAVLLLPHILCL